METVRLDDSMTALLADAKQTAAVIDGAGRLIGFYAPVGQEYAKDYAEAAAQMYVRLQAMADEPGPRYTTAEVMAHLETLETK